LLIIEFSLLICPLLRTLKLVMAQLLSLFLLEVCWVRPKDFLIEVRLNSLNNCLLGIHPTVIAESFKKAALKSVDILTGMSTKLELSDRESLLKSATTSLSSKVVSQYSSLLAPMAVDAVMNVTDQAKATNVDLKDIRVVTKVGGTIDDTELVNGLVLTQDVIKSAGGPTRVEKAKIALIQFQLSPPKPDVRFILMLITYT
jgi:T-complex protein 1 subunit delta